MKFFPPSLKRIWSRLTECSLTSTCMELQAGDCQVLIRTYKISPSQLVLSTYHPMQGGRLLMLTIHRSKTALQLSLQAMRKDCEDLRSILSSLSIATPPLYFWELHTRTWRKTTIRMLHMEKQNESFMAPTMGWATRKSPTSMTWS